MTRTWNPQDDPTLQGRGWLNNFRYAWFFWALLVLGLVALVGSVVAGRAPGIVGGVLMAAAAFAIRHAGRIRRDEVDIRFLRAYGAEAGWFVAGLALFVVGVWLARSG